MARVRILLCSLVLVSPVAAQRQAIGTFSQWGAFRDTDRCFATAQPSYGPRPQGWRPFAAVSFWPARNARNQIHFRLSRQKRPGSAILLRIDGRTFQILGGGINAWAAGQAADAEIAAAMRTGVNMSVETRTVRGGLMRDVYQLRGAATAIDAAAIACSARPGAPA